MTAMPRVAVMGGSLGGLTAALCAARRRLRRRGVSSGPARAPAGPGRRHRGAGRDPALPRASGAVADPDEICAATRLDPVPPPDGRPVRERGHRYRFSSWNTVYRALLAGSAGSATGSAARSSPSRPDGDRGATCAWTAAGATGRTCSSAPTASNSTARAGARCPTRRPAYAGIRRLARHRSGGRPRARRPSRALQDAITYQVLPDSPHPRLPHPRADGAVQAGRRLINFVWYRNVAAGAAFEDLMTGRGRA